ncbi:type II secretion system F family protein [Vibrio casei]|uniref:Type II secretion system F family protein n=1 Tax=Vibrio casei TaxID=673372 RepID=A0A368LL42_9VIBR|nr:type II secretion system F family protein [Vibrio casei]RCS72506.1 type II secretion system F family protein [Vibrio casei]SJN36315.1 Type IV fimbrial assembly protein PilC [Vibrio casei]
MATTSTLKAPALKNFQWRGINNSGKKVSGQILAINESEVRNKLKEQRVQIKKLKRRSVSIFAKMSHKVKRKDITILTRQLATMLTTGVPIVQSFKLISDSQRKAEMKSILSQICTQVEAGTPISKALHASSPFFDDFFCDLVATGEQTGNLAEVFERLATYREKSEELRSKVIKAMIYPAMVISVATIVSILMLTMVIPEFETMFSSMGAELPWFTQQVVNLSHFIQSYLFMMMAAIFILIFCIKEARKRSFSFRLKTSRMALNMPVLGGVFTKAAIAKFSRTLATSFNAGIPILTSLLTTAKTSGNLHYQVAIEQVHKDTAAGMPMYIAMRNADAFPKMVLQMVMIGEESGNLDDMLNKVAAIYEFEVDNTVDNLGKIIEPVIIVFLGVVVGGLVVSLYLPIFKMASVF